MAEGSLQFFSLLPFFSVAVVLVKGNHQVGLSWHFQCLTKVVDFSGSNVRVHRGQLRQIQPHMFRPCAMWIFVAAVQPSKFGSRKAIGVGESSRPFDFYRTRVTRSVEAING